MKIITDSTADLTRELYEQLDIGMVPLTIQLGERRWRDFYDMKPEAYFPILRASTDFPITSQPSPQDFINAYTPFVDKDEPILSIHISSGLSGTYQSACLARANFSDARIEVVDSHQASLGLALVLHLCVKKIHSGFSYEAVVDYARGLSQKIDTFFSVDSLDYLHRGGRIGRAQAFLGTLMKIKPLLKLIDGAIHPVEKVRTTERLLNRYVELVEKKAAEDLPLSLIVAESDNTDVVTNLVNRLIKIPNVTLIQRCTIGGVIASHTGPGVIGVTFVSHER
jgi:DegV family protein with EDD domain